ncbi:MAG: hypothetical protein QOE36_3692 [Gaiellaceae bacterium]|nr:hypothetical protein [Gaiellaceae bacterium]
MADLTDLRGAVVGTGFVAALHVDALRRLGIEVAGVVGSTPERAREKRLGPVYESYDALLADDGVDVVHLATPNHLHHGQAKQALAAGKHVICEKPLALTAAESAELVELAEASGLVHCTNFNLRFYPHVHEVRERIADGRLGQIWNVHGGYLQDWLLLSTDWNWRLDPAAGGDLRAVGDIGSHWLDLVQFATGLEVEAVFADLATTLPVRQRPTGPVETFVGGAGETEDVEIITEDLAHILVRFGGGARGSVVVSQVSAGRKNSLRFEVDGSEGAAAWDSERPEELWLGHRGRANEILLRDPSLFEPSAQQRTVLPAGHSEGFSETLRELYRAVYGAVAASGPPEAPDYPTFHDGHWENLLGEAVARSAREGAWTEVAR